MRLGTLLGGLMYSSDDYTKEFPVADDEVARLKALRNLHILNTMPEERFNVMSRVAQHLLSIDSGDESQLLKDLALLIEHNRESIALRHALEKSLMIEKALKERETHYKTLLENIADCVFVIDSNWMIQSINLAAEKKLGCKSSDCIGRNISMFFQQCVENELTLWFGQDPKVDSEDLSPQFMIATWQCKDGTQHTCELIGSSMTFKDEKLFIWILRDNIQKREADSIKDVFISSVNHVLRTPITAIHGALGLILGLFNQNMTDDAKKHIGTAHGTSEQLVHMMNEILDGKKIDGGGISRLKLQEVDVNPLITNAINSVRPLAEQKKVKIIVEYPSEPCFAYADANRFIYVLKDLFSNAIKQVQINGTITIRIEHSEDKLKVSVFSNQFEEPIKPEPEIDHSNSAANITKAIIEKLSGRLDREMKNGYCIVLDCVIRS